MVKKTCDHCSVSSTDMKGWAECPTCEKTYCATCVDGMRKEADQIKTLRTGDSLSRTAALCPSCEVQLHPLGV